MLRNVKCLGLILFALSLVSSIAFADVEIGNIKIKDDGRIVFSDNSEQSTATLKGDKGDKGEKGDPGTPGSQVTRDAICQTYADDNLPAPPFCHKKIIFITSNEFTSNLGGLVGADSKCQEAANVATLQGIYKAWLSDSNISARDRLAHSPAAYVRVDGSTVANNWTDLTDGWLKEPIMIDEFRNNLVGQGAAAWTGTDAYGRSTGNNCADWTSTSQGWFELGSADNIGSGWSGGSVNACGSNNNKPFRLICIQQ
ncbi:MAG: DUF1554 domain-containing protein [Desulfuromonadales bacterium]|nr:DUF1554 domain-containing protein [Desulfuromonadales bacterium]